MILCAGRREVTLSAAFVSRDSLRTPADRSVTTVRANEQTESTCQSEGSTTAAPGPSRDGVCAQCLWMTGLEATARGLDCWKTSRSEYSITARGLDCSRTSRSEFAASTRVLTRRSFVRPHTYLPVSGTCS